MQNADIIRIETNTTELVIRGEIDKIAEILYFGQKSLMSTPEWQNIPAAGPLYPTDGDIWRREAAMHVYRNGFPATVRLRYRGYNKVDNQVVEIYLYDPVLLLKVTVIYQVFESSDILVQKVAITNTGSEPLLFSGVASCYLPIIWEQTMVTTLQGSWANEMNVSSHELVSGIYSFGETCGTRTTRFANPSCILSEGYTSLQETAGACIGGHLSWSGNWRIAIEKGVEEAPALIAGIHPQTQHLILNPSAAWTTPEWNFCYSEAGMQHVSQEFHRWIRNNRLREGNTTRAVVLNSWEAAYFSFTENSIISMIESAAKLGVEQFVLDDGWFGTEFPRDSDSAGLGDWEINRNKLPGGLTALITAAKKAGIAFGIWVEPEMVNPKSRLYQDHPDWIVNAPGYEPIHERNQFILDLTKGEVQAYIKHFLDKLIQENPGIRYIKWDCNRHMNGYNSAAVQANGEERDSHNDVQRDYIEAYALAVQSIFSYISETYPDIILQNCASGGGRVELQTLSHAHEFWTSDNTDALQRISIQWGTSYFFPAIAMANHVSSKENHITKRPIPLSFRLAVAMAGRLGFELPPQSLDPQEIELVKKYIDFYKKVRRIIHTGDLYRIVSPLEHTYAVISFVSTDKNEAVVFGWMCDYKRGHYKSPVRLPGLFAEKNYRLYSVGDDPEKYEEISGHRLLTAGIKLPLETAFASAVYYLKAEDLCQQ